ncbi:MAG: signal transduction histidine kinase/CheY-like chemotaxis protein, partial [Gammaproteobacteria bacterium]
CMVFRYIGVRRMGAFNARGISTADGDHLTQLGRPGSAGESLKCHRLKAELTRASAMRANSEGELERIRQLSAQESESRDKMMASISHEIRTPLTCVIGYIDICLSRKLPRSEMLSKLAIAKRCSNSLMRLVDDLMQVTRGGLDASEAEFETFDVLSVLEEARLSFEASMRAKDIEIAIDSQEDVIDICSNVSRVRQVVMNLLGNALKFTDKGFVSICATADDFGGLCLEFADSGIGIAPDHQAKIFEPFFAVDDDRHCKRGGVGLGLAITKDIVESLGGNLKVKSIRGSGSVFSVSIPNVVEDPVVCRVEQASDAVREKVDRRILVVDDSPDIQEILKLQFGAYGCVVATADNGLAGAQSALDAQRLGTPFDIVLMDLQMPGMDGLEATRFLRTSGYEGAVIAFSAHTAKSKQKTCLAAGCDSFLCKPVNVEDVLDYLNVSGD